jgi:prophage DNA circulation protein
VTQPKPQASFRGAGFYVSAHDTEVGRRQPTAALPFQDQGVTSTDLGRAPRVFNLQALVLGDDYASARDKLIAALEQSGPGILVHPVFGRVSVVVSRSIRVSESTTELRVARIAFRAVETFDQPPQSPGFPAGSALKNAAKLGRSAAGVSFANPATGLKHAISDFVSAAHLDVLDNVLTDMRAVNGAIAAVLSVPTGFAAQIDAISREAASLLATPRRLFDAIDATLDLMAQATLRLLGPEGQDILQDDATAALVSPLRKSRTLLRAIDPISTLGSASPAVPDIDTPERNDQRDGQLAIQRHFRASGLFGLAAAAADATFSSAADAEDVRDALAGALVDLADSEPDLDSPLIFELKHAAALVMTHLTETAAKMPLVIEYTPPHTVPAEVIAWNLYADAERADEIIERNPSIHHPGFVSGKVALEVAKT